MLSMERMDYILQALQENKVVLVGRLSEEYKVSPSTIRRDLAALEKEGIVRRTYGGAVLVEHQSTEIPYAIRQVERQTEKTMIGRLAARLVKDDMYITMDCTSTVSHMVRFLSKKKNLKILTNSAQLSLDCLDSSQVQICCTGGWMNPFNRGFTGEAARARIAEFHSDLFFFSARAIDLSAGITDVNEEDVYLKQQMLSSSRKAVFLCDSSKFDKISYRSLCGFFDIACLITDKKPADEYLERLEKVRVRVIWPHETGEMEPRI